MDFKLSEEQIAFQKSVEKFARNEIAPLTTEAERESRFSFEAWKKMADFGMMGLPFPEKYGGSEAGVLTTCLGMEAMGRAGVDAGSTMAWGASTILCGVPIWLLGNEEQREQYLPKMITGEWIGGMGLTEPNAGSDAAGMQTTAVKKGDKYIMNGSKMFITNGPIGHHFVVMAVTDKDAGHFGMSAFIVDADFPGFSVSKELDKMGNRASVTSELIFEDCEIPEKNLLGQPGMGFIGVGKTILEWERSCLIAAGVGGLQFLLNDNVQYSKERHQFGKPIAHFQAMKHKLADMRVAVSATRLLLYRVAWMKDNNQSAMMEASMNKLMCSEMGMRVCEESVQLHGGYGYMKEYACERAFRDAKLGTIGAGTSEVQRMIIAKMLLNLKKGGKK